MPTSAALRVAGMRNVYANGAKITSLGNALLLITTGLGGYCSEEGLHRGERPGSKRSTFRLELFSLGRSPLGLELGLVLLYWGITLTLGMELFSLGLARITGGAPATYTSLMMKTQITGWLPLPRWYGYLCRWNMGDAKS